jgi:hypothetical protein
MKKFFSVVLAALFVFTAATVMTAPSYADDIKVVYLDSAKGSDKNSGATPGKAVATLYAAIDLLGDTGGVIDVVGDTVLDDPNLTEDMQTAAGYQLDMPMQLKKIYITSTNGSKLIKSEPTTGTTISFFGPIEFYNITFKNTQAQNLNIYMYCNELTVGFGVDAEADSQTHCPRLFGFTANPDDGIDGNPVINIFSGNFGNIYGAGSAGAKTVNGNVTINMYGGKADYIYDGGPGNVVGNTTINLYNGATVINKVTKSGTVSGTRTLNLYNYTSDDESKLPFTASDFTTVNKGLTASVPLPSSVNIEFTVATDDPNETTNTPAVTDAPVTTAPVTTAPVTTAPATTAAATTKAPDNTAAPATGTAPATTKAGSSDNGGCGGTTAAIPAALVMLAGTAYGFLKKKKEGR